MVNYFLQGIWTGMIGGTLMQTIILLIVTIRNDWEKEVNYKLLLFIFSQIANYLFKFLVSMFLIDCKVYYGLNLNFRWRRLRDD